MSKPHATADNTPEQMEPRDPSLASSSEPDTVERRNIIALVAHQALFRIAWIFKTESVIMPAFLDSISGAGWVRGMLPPLNRFGQSFAPLLLSEKLAQTPSKSRWLAIITMLMSLPFLSLGLMLAWLDGRRPAWFVGFFLLAYGTFFCMHGVKQATFNTLQGKLIRPDRRGRLVALAGYVGSPCAVILALLLLRPWTEAQPPRFAWIFLFTGTVFLMASFTVRRVQEVADPVHPRSRLSFRKRFADAKAALRADASLRRLCWVAGLFVSALLLFPHYQRLGREQPHYNGQMLMIWVVCQNLSAAFFSWASGRAADRYGNRRALRWLTFLAAFAPVVPLVITYVADARWYWLTFCWLGFVPVTFRMLLNYALELTDRSRHPIYVSTVVLSMSPAILLSPLVGEFVERVGYVLPFTLMSVVALASWGLTLTLVEPRSEAFQPASGLDEA